MTIKKNKIKIYAMILLVFGFVVAPSKNLFAESISGPSEPQDFAKDLAKESQWIVLGKVKKMRSSVASFQSDNKKEVFIREKEITGGQKGIIFTEVTVEVEKIYKEEVSHEIKIRYLGGCVVDQCLTFSDQPQVKASDRALFFLSKPDKHFIINFGNEGVWKVGEGDLVIKTGQKLQSFENDLGLTPLDLLITEGQYK